MEDHDGRDTWSNLTINQIEAHLSTLRMRIPYLQGNMKVEVARGSTRGADVTLTLPDNTGVEHRLFFEVEQYASGSNLQAKIIRWADRHNAVPNGMTVVISLVMQALLNRLTGSYSKNESIRRMVFSKNFRIYAGSGDGRLTDELTTLITLWIEERL
jgi:hypothetical protein